MGRLRFVLVTVLLLVATGQIPTSALDLLHWSDDTAGADTEPATDVVTDSGGVNDLTFDHSEDGSVIAAIWRGGNPSNMKMSVGWTDGTSVKWSAARNVTKDPLRSAYYPSITVSGDGSTVYAAWTEQSGITGQFDDTMVSTGAISIDPNTHVPTVTWAPTYQFVKSNHQWFPSIDTSYTGEKVVITHWDSEGSSWNFTAHTANVTVSGSSRSATWKGPQTITTPDWTYTPSKPALQLKVSRDGTRATAAWWNPYTPMASGYGRIETSSADIGNNLAFPNSLYGSAWSARTVISAASNSLSTSPPSLDLSDDGTKAIVAWQGRVGSAASDQKFTAVSVANIPTATNPSWSAEQRLYQGAEETRRPKVTMSSNGSRAMVSWTKMASSTTSGITTALASIDGAGSPTWSPTTDVNVGTASWDYVVASMSKDGGTGVGLIASGSPVVVKSTATNIYGPTSSLNTDWASSFTSLSSVASQANSAIPFLAIGKNGSIITAMWVSSNTIWVRSISQDPPTISSVSPTADDIAGGTLVTINGSNFKPNPVVTIGGTTCSGPTLVSSTQITCTAAASTHGAKDVTVTNIDGQSGTSIGAFTYTTTTTTTTLPPTTTSTVVNQISPAASTTTTVASQSASSTTIGSQTNSSGTDSTVDNQNNTSTTIVGGTTTTLTSSDSYLASIVKQLKEQDIVDDGINSQRQVSAGASILLTSKGFEANEGVQVLLDADSVQVLKEFNATSGGVASVEVTIPKDVVGEHTIAMYAPGSGHGYRTTIVVTQVGSSSSQMAATLFVVVVLLAIFLFLLLRRRQNHENK